MAGSNVPHSSSRMFFESMRELYVKYVERNVAPLEINIPCEIRNDIAVVLAPDTNESDINIHFIVIKMERAIENIAQLMSDTAIRYSAHVKEHAAVQTPAI